MSGEAMTGRLSRLPDLRLTQPEPGNELEPVSLAVQSATLPLTLNRRLARDPGVNDPTPWVFAACSHRCSLKNPKSFSLMDCISVWRRNGMQQRIAFLA
jgi:hypothetical protein